jgi:uncharacterized protein (DUF1499 family)
MAVTGTGELRMTGRRVVLAAVSLMLLTGCGGRHLTVADDGSLALAGCSPLPSCVSSTTWVLYNRVSAFELTVPRESAWPIIRDVVARMPRTEIVASDDVFIHAKWTSRVFGFVDNLELLLQPGQGTVAVRSSSTFAIFDFGVNRWRVYSLRRQLEEMKVIRE